MLSSRRHGRTGEHKYRLRARRQRCWKRSYGTNLVPRALSYPLYGALSRSVGRVGENSGNEVDMEQETAPRRFFLHVALCANLSPFTLASRNIDKAL